MCTFYGILSCTFWEFIHLMAFGKLCWRLLCPCQLTEAHPGASEDHPNTESDLCCVFKTRSLYRASCVDLSARVKHSQKANFQIQMTPFFTAMMESVDIMMILHLGNWEPFQAPGVIIIIVAMKWFLWAEIVQKSKMSMSEETSAWLKCVEFLKDTWLKLQPTVLFTVDWSVVHPLA